MSGGRNGWFAIILAALTAWFAVSCCTAEPVDYLPELEQLIFQKTNVERVQRRMPGPGGQTFHPFDLDPELSRVARFHAADMLARDYFSHSSPDGDTVSERIARMHRFLIAERAGENIWRQRNAGPGDLESLSREILREWMYSLGHRANILSPYFTHLGAGAATSGDRVTAVQVFAAEVALTDLPVPDRLQRSRRYSVSVNPLTQNLGVLEKIDFWDPVRQESVGLPERLPRARISVPAGKYLIRFYFRDIRMNRWRIYRGPEVEVD